MFEVLCDLIAHKGYANASLLDAIRQNDAAAADPELRQLLHHILAANRFWLLAVLQQPFVYEDELRPAASLDALVGRYRRTQEEEAAWLSNAAEADLERTLENSLIPGGSCSVAQGLIQVCMHSHGHRAQCAKLLRRHDGAPPMTDFILWLAGRPVAQWPIPLSSVGTP